MLTAAHGRGLGADSLARVKSTAPIYRYSYKYLEGSLTDIMTIWQNNNNMQYLRVCDFLDLV